MPISGSSYYDENKENSGKKKPFFRAYLDALKAGKRALDAAASDTSAPAVSPPLQATPVPIAPPVTYAAPPVEALDAPSVAAAPLEAISAAAPRVARRPAKRRRSTSDSTEMTAATSASMDVMMQHILELAQKVEAAASKVEAVADKADASARPAAEDGAMVTTRTSFARPAPQPFSAHTGAANSGEAPAIPPVISDPVMRPAMPTAPPSSRNGDAETYGRATAASGLAPLEHEMSIPKVAPFILEEAKAAPTQPIPELRKVDSPIPDLHLTKTQDEPRPQGAPIVLRSQKIDSRAVNDGR